MCHRRSEADANQVFADAMSPLGHKPRSVRAPSNMLHETTTGDGNLSREQSAPRPHPSQNHPHVPNHLPPPIPPQKPTPHHPLHTRPLLHLNPQTLPHQPRRISESTPTIFFQAFICPLFSTPLFKSHNCRTKRAPQPLLRLRRILERTFPDQQHVRDDAERPDVLFFAVVPLPAENFGAGVVEAEGWSRSADRKVRGREREGSDHERKEEERKVR